VKLRAGNTWEDPNTQPSELEVAQWGIIRGIGLARYLFRIEPIEQIWLGIIACVLFLPRILLDQPLSHHWRFDVILLSSILLIGIPLQRWLEWRNNEEVYGWWVTDARQIRSDKNHA
jgi:hypothetical protein